MAKLDAKKLLDQAGPSYVAELEGEKAARFKARTMLIPSPGEIREAIAAIPKGEARSLRDLRADLARQAGADVTCPAMAAKYWRLLAHASEAGQEEVGNEGPLPWWRVTRDGRPNPLLPGGEARHRDLLRAEGVSM